MKKISMIIRFILTFGLIYAVYTETGIWTGIALFLVFLGMEIHAFLIKKTINHNAGLHQIFKGNGSVEYNRKWRKEAKDDTRKRT